MDVSFDSAELAALCNSERCLTDRWGPELGRSIARRLLDVAAADAASLDRLPGARVSVNGTGETTIAFGGAIVVRGVISKSNDGPPGARAETDSMVITGLDGHGGDER